MYVHGDISEAISSKVDIKNICWYKSIYIYYKR